MKIEQKSFQQSAQAALVKEHKSAHFYTQDGLPRYTDKVRSGKNKGKECSVNLTHARREKLYPSITHIFGILEARGLSIYRESHLLAAARKLQPFPNESDEDYFSRVNFEARKDGMEAAQQGTDTHAGIEAILKGEPWDKSNPMLVNCARWFESHIEKPIWTEKCCINHSLRLAGRCDALLKFKSTSPFHEELQGRPVVVDFKTRRFKKFEAKPNWRPPKYTKDVMQVAFYASTVESSSFPRGANLLINTTEQAPNDLFPEFRLYSRDEQFRALVSVAHLVAVWRHENNYHPIPKNIPATEFARMQGVGERMWG